MSLGEKALKKAVSAQNVPKKRNRKPVLINCRSISANGAESFDDGLAERWIPIKLNSEVKDLEKEEFTMVRRVAGMEWQNGG
ncbi:hypothetical protein JTE90_025327 [Oedothorax gibbosus]|uniref:Uncharacterized protein n=1 Tax=Oedothorax gibbosus TaxID=931172 RepID=A0AAV6V8K5_9ARAC|nr:hypothetical protein JTE90_025327 [Oedothorax gibbosus]